MNQGAPPARLDPSCGFVADSLRLADPPLCVFFSSSDVAELMILTLLLQVLLDLPRAERMHRSPVRPLPRLCVALPAPLALFRPTLTCLRTHRPSHARRRTPAARPRQEVVPVQRTSSSPSSSLSSRRRSSMRSSSRSCARPASAPTPQSTVDSASRSDPFFRSFVLTHLPRPSSPSPLPQVHVCSVRPLSLLLSRHMQTHLTSSSSSQRRQGHPALRVSMSGSRLESGRRGVLEFSLCPSFVPLYL